MPRLTLEQSVNKQVQAANARFDAATKAAKERHEAALRRQADRLMPLVADAEDGFSVLQAESLANIIVSVVAEKVLLHRRQTIEAVELGAQIWNLEFPDGTLLLDEVSMDVLAKEFDPTGERKKYFDLTRVSFGEMLVQRLQAAHQRGLIPEVYYDHWEIGTGRLSA